MAVAEVFQVSDIRIEGLQRIAPGTVFNYLPVQVGDTVGEDVTGGIIRALYQTGFFDDVRVERDGSVLVLWVRERPAIAEIKITGNKDIDTKALDAALADIGLKEGSRLQPLGAGPHRTGAGAPVFRPRQIRRHHSVHRLTAGAQPGRHQYRDHRRA
jgi:hypothetical protein